MPKYDKLKKKYDKLIKRELEKNKQILIDSFVEYYGEEFRTLIESRYNEISFVYYIDWDMVEYAIKKVIPRAEDPTKYDDFINFYNSRKAKKPPFENVFKKKQSDLPNNLIGTTNSSIFSINYIKSVLPQILNNHDPVNLLYKNDNQIYRVVVFQILSLNEQMIIHEINHAITRDFMSYIAKNYINIANITKSGLSVETMGKYDDGNIFEELINDKSSYEIARIFKRRGGNFSSFCCNISLDSYYEYNFHLIDQFYDKFKKYIKIAKISDNKNELINRVGKENYKDFVEVVNTHYLEKPSFYNRVKASEKTKVIIEKMEKNLKNEKTLSQSDLNEYYEKLRSEGYEVKVLNELENEENENRKRR